jgi:oxygen-independent coproporphyrinogen-3 oxidase
MASCLYIHFPFCVRKCIYCDFLSIPYDEALAHGYVDALCREMTLRKGSAAEFRTIYFGGGTPTILPPDCFGQIFHCIRQDFAISSAAEISVEMNPGTMRGQTVDMLLGLGVNRFSVGVQSFRDNELRMLGRIHTADEAIKTIEKLKTAGAVNFSVDLLYGIPGQTMETWKETLSTAIGLSPPHISAYELTPEKETPLYRHIDAGRISMPDEDLAAAMHGLAIDLLASSGYMHYEISNYARPGFRCLHNVNYWDRGEYIGAGAGAHSFLDGMRWMNTKDIGKYVSLLGSNILPEENRAALSPEDVKREFLFLGLRKTEGISLEKAAAFGLHTEENCIDLIEDGYVVNSKGSLMLTRKGLLISNTVIVTLFERLGL